MMQISEAEYGTTASRQMMGSMARDMMGMSMTIDMQADMKAHESSSTPDGTFLG